jgi:hypothetical protein
MRRLVLGAAWVASVALAFVLGGRGPAPRLASVAPPSAAAPALTAAEVRAIVRSELAARAPAPAVVPAAAVPRIEPEVEPGPSPHYGEARSLVDNAVARGRWTEVDRLQLRSYLSGLTKDEVDGLFATLVPAVNGGAVTVDFQGPPL